MKEVKDLKPVKDRLAHSLRLHDRMKKKLIRLDALERQMLSPSSPNLTGMPHESGPNIDRMAEAVGRKVDTEVEIQQLQVVINQDRRELAELFARLDPDEELVCTLRYIDALGWNDVVATMYDSEPDFEDEIDRYQNKTYKSHGRALLNLWPFIKPDAEDGSDRSEEVEEGGDEP